MKTQYINNLQREIDDGDRACPCLYLEEPCHPQCTCKNGYSSIGCAYCCSYGSLEQRKDKAIVLSTKLSRSSDYAKLQTQLLEQKELINEVLREMSTHGLLHGHKSLFDKLNSYKEKYGNK